MDFFAFGKADSFATKSFDACSQGQMIPFNRFGNSCCNPIINLNGSGIMLDEPGSYKVSVSAVAKPTAAGLVTLTLFQDGVAVPGGVATGTAAAGDAVNLNIEAIVKVRCGSTGSLTVQLTVGAGTVSNIAVSVVKL